MCNSERASKASVTTIWSDAYYGMEPVKVSIVNGVAKIRIYGFDLPVPGEFEQGHIEGVITEETKRRQEINVALDALPEGWEPPCSKLPETFEPVAGLDYVEIEEEKHEVVYLDEVMRND